MSLSALLLLAIALAADCFAVSLALGAALPQVRAVRWREGLRTGLVFGGMQMAMALAGSLVGAASLSLLARFTQGLGVLLLLAVAAHMAFEAWEEWREEEEEEEEAADTTCAAAGREDEGRDMRAGWWRLLALGVATSLDSLAAGFSLKALGGMMALALPAIGGASLLAALIGLLMGGHARRLLGPLAEALGAVILTGIAIASLFA
ncbi:MAG: hypothetical protein D6740_08280 [Alphaproteobacteria bacterium]|nr:MAG: hypothetical protein D6740_08280 [Alphaproteobacteria bacterium]